MKKSYTILYVDDDYDDLFLISEAFSNYTEKLNVVHACNGQEGLGVLKTMMDVQKLPCLIIMDINMPILDGKETLKIIRTSEKIEKIPVVLFSTSKNELDIQFAKQWDAHFISKPDKFLQMENLVQEFVQYCEFEVEGEGKISHSELIQAAPSFQKKF
ncbi:MAG: response regulator [Flavisolibacter sp.]